MMRYVKFHSLPLKEFCIFHGRLCVKVDQESLYDLQAGITKIIDTERYGVFLPVSRFTELQLQEKDLRKL